MNYLLTIFLSTTVEFITVMMIKLSSCKYSIYTDTYFPVIYIYSAPYADYLLGKPSECFGLHTISGSLVSATFPPSLTAFSSISRSGGTLGSSFILNFF